MVKVSKTNAPFIYVKIIFYEEFLKKKSFSLFNYNVKNKKC